MRNFSYSTDLTKEKEANAFAAELLMPQEIFTEVCYGYSIGKELFRKISECLNVSLTAAVLKYAALVKHPFSVIMTKYNRVEWNFVNDYFVFVPVPKGRQKPTIVPDSLLIMGKVNRSLFRENTYRNNREYKTINANDWYKHDSRCGYFDKLKQMDIEMPNYNSTLTVLWEEGV